MLSAVGPEGLTARLLVEIAHGIEPMQDGRTCLPNPGADQCVWVPPTVSRQTEEEMDPRTEPIGPLLARQPAWTAFWEAASRQN